MDSSLREAEGSIPFNFIFHFFVSSSAADLAHRQHRGTFRFANVRIDIEAF